MHISKQLIYDGTKLSRIETEKSLNNIKYKDSETEKLVIAQQSLIKYDVKYTKPVAKSKRKDKSQLNFDF
jgi:hypothetical protein